MPEDYSVEEMNAPVEEAQVADVPEQGGAEEEVYAADLVGGTEQQATVVESADDGQLPKVSNQKDFNAALSQRLAGENTKGYNRAKAEYEASPEMQLVRALIQDRAREKGITEQQALQELQNDRIRQVSENYAKNPAQFYEDILRGRTTLNAPQYQQTDALTADMSQQMANAIRGGQIPEGFDVKNPGNQFFEDFTKYRSVEVALRLWQAEHQSEANARQVAAELQRRQKAPKPMSPTSANPASPAPPDYANMSDADFRKLEEQIARATLQGKRVRLG